MSDESLLGWLLLQLDVENFCTHDTTRNFFQGSSSTTGMVADVPRGDSTMTSLVDPGGEPGPVWLWDDAFLFANRHLIVVCTQTCIFRCCIVLRQLYAWCMRCCILVAVMLWYHVEIRGIWQCHMSRWDRYVLRPRIWIVTSRSGTVPHIGPYKL